MAADFAHGRTMNNMNRFTVLHPSGHLSISTADRIALATTVTPGEFTDTRPSFDFTDPALSYYKPDKAEDTETLQGEPVQFKSDVRFYLAFSALAALSLVVALDGTSISVALPVIAQALDGTAIEAFWAGTAFLLTSTVFQPIYASFSCIYGRKQVTLIAVTFFLAGMVIAGTAPIMILMLIGRAIQGIGGSGIIALTSILITDLVPLRHRGNWMGILGAVWAIGSVIGPVVGGSLAHPNTWYWIFYLNLPFIGVSFILVALFIRLRSIPERFASKMRRADWLGSVVFVGSMTAILIPLTWAGISYAWTSWHVVVPIGFGITGLIILAFHERYLAIEPVIRVVVFANRTTNIAFFAAALHGMSLWSLLYYQPLYFEGVRGYSPVIAGVALFPATFTVAPMVIVAGVVISKTGCYRWAVWFGWGMTTLGVGFLCAIDADTQLTQVLLTDLLAGIGLGALFPALQFQLQAASNPKNLAFAVAMFSFFRSLGQTLGIAIGGNIFQNQLASKLAQQPMFAARAQELAKDATSLVEFMSTAPDDDARRILRVAFSESMRTVYIAIAAIAFTAATASLFIKHYDLNQELETEQALVRDDA